MDTDKLAEEVLGKGGRSIHELSQEELIVLVHEMLRTMHAQGQALDATFRCAQSQHRTIIGMSVCLGVIVLLEIGRAVAKALA